jgi:hypothetical protein
VTILFSSDLEVLKLDYGSFFIIIVSDVYEGSFYNGLFNGEGKYTWSNGNVYAGSWLNGKRAGQGRLAYGASSSSSGEEFEGSWENNQMDGYGVYRWPDGGMYEGQWVGGRREGFGVRSWADLSSYSGGLDNFTVCPLLTLLFFCFFLVSMMQKIHFHPERECR